MFYAVLLPLCAKSRSVIFFYRSDQRHKVYKPQNGNETPHNA